MTTVTVRIPMIDGGPIPPRQVSRDFNGSLPDAESVAFVARIIRDGIEIARYPEYKRLIELSDDYLVQQIALATAVPNDVWIRNGFYPLSDWEPAHGR